MTRRSHGGLRRRARRLLDASIEAALDVVSTLRVGWARARGAGPDAGRRILVLDEHLPDPRFGAGYPRAAELLHALVDAGWDVTMYPMVASATEYPSIRANHAGTSIRFVESRGVRGLRRLMRENTASFAVTLVSRPATMDAYTRTRARVPSFATRCIYDAEAVFAVRDFRRRAIFGPPMTDAEYQRALQDEVDLVAGADALITVTEADARLFRERTAIPVHVIGHSIETRSSPADFDRRIDLLFIGRCTGPRTQSPNVDSLHWFVSDVMPLIDAAMEIGYRLVVAGLADADIVAALRSDRVVFEGVVDDLGPLYDRCRVFVAPTRFAAGLPHKVGEAAAAGIPCVVTTLLAEQLAFADGVELSAAANAAQFADRCVALYREPDLWSRIREAALARVRVEYSREAFREAVDSAVAGVEDARLRAVRPRSAL